MALVVLLVGRIRGYCALGEARDEAPALAAVPVDGPVVAVFLEFRARGDERAGARLAMACFVFLPFLREWDWLMGVNATEAAIAVQQGRLCEPSEVAAAVLFLASDESSFVNGTHLFVDNGFSAV